MTRVADKAIRLLAEGRVQPNGTVQEFKIHGDGGVYTAFLGPHTAVCTCPARRRCKHLDAAAAWIAESDEERGLMQQAVAERQARTVAAWAKLADYFEDTRRARG